MPVKKKKKQTRKPRGKVDPNLNTLPSRPVERFSFFGNGRPRAFADEMQLRDGIREYVEWCRGEGKRIPTMAGVAVWFSLDKSTLWDYQNGLYDREDCKFSNPLKEFKIFLEDDRLNNGLQGIYNPAIAKFDMANNHGYSEKQDITAKVAQAVAINVEDFNDPIKAADAYKRMLEAGE